MRKKIKILIAIDAVLILLTLMSMIWTHATTSLLSLTLTFFILFVTLTMFSFTHQVSTQKRIDMFFKARKEYQKEIMRLLRENKELKDVIEGLQKKDSEKIPPKKGSKK